MDGYIRLGDIPKHFGLNRGDSVWVASDVKTLLYNCIENGDDTDLNVLIDGILDIITEEGTLLIPTFNWDFCKGKAFDIRTSPCRTGSLGKIALKRKDFIRTRHPIYSFAVWGRDAKKLAEMDNLSSFGGNSPFSYCREVNAKNVFIDVPPQHSFTFVHYVEQMKGVSYRYLKAFSADYTDENGITTKRTYSMNVRCLDRDIFLTIYPFEELFEKAGASKQYQVNGISMETIEMGRVYDIIADDVINHDSSRICTFKGQKESMAKNSWETLWRK